MIYGLVSGCFDSLHLGHLKLLREAYNNCDYLVVAINSSDYIRRIKKREPMNSELERYVDVLSTGLVDDAIIFNEDTPIDIINLYKPQRLFLGFERDNYVIPWEDSVKEWGAEIFIIPKLEGYSSSKIYEQYKISSC